MRIAIIGAGPAGLVLGAALARRGHYVTAVDRDPGPPVDGTWERRGVMQFHHAHAFRSTVIESLQRELARGRARLARHGCRTDHGGHGRPADPDRASLAS